MSESKFYICRVCGNLVGVVNYGGGTLVCCGQEMEELKPNTVEASSEKHLPVITVQGDTVKVVIGSVLHPMIAEHHIEWIYLQTENGGQRKSLKVGEAPEATFALSGDKPVAAYAYCNLHGLWKTAL